MVWIVGGVLSHNPMLATRGQLLGAVAFHAAFMVLGMACLQKALAVRQAASVPGESV